MIEIILFALSVVGAFIIGLIVGKCGQKDDPVGILYIVEDPNPKIEPYVCSEFYDSPRTFKTKKYVTFEVNSQK